MRSLLVCDLLPWRPFGGSMRAATVATALAGLGPVDLLVVANGAYPVPAGTPFDRVQILPEMPPGGPLTMADRLAAVRRQVHSEAAAWLRTTRYDTVWYSRERTWLKTYGLVDAPSIVDVDDLEEVLLERWLAVDRGPDGRPWDPARRAAARVEAAWWAATHRHTAAAVDVVAFTSEGDRCRFGFPHAVTVPNTYDVPPDAGVAVPVDVGAGPVVMFQGSLTWPPNEDAAVRLVTEVAPRIRRTHPDLTVLLVGSPSARVRALGGPGVHVAGRVPDMAPYLAASDLVAVPLRVGGGTRIKILEAFAHGVPVVSTSVGAEGLAVTGGVEILLADTDAALADRCVRLLDDPALGGALATRARQLHQKAYRAVHAHERVRAAVALARRGHAG